MPGRADPVASGRRRAGRLCALFRRALACWEDGEAREVERLAREAIAIAPEAMRGHAMLASALFLQRNLRGALASFRRASTIAPEEARLVYNAGWCLHELGRHDEAVAAYRRSLEIDGSMHRARSAIAKALFEGGRREEARSELRRWLRDAPGALAARVELAALGGAPAPARIPRAYLVDHFDRFAPNFDDTLEELEYRGPQEIGRTVRDHAGDPAGRLRVLDAGCGTGLCGPSLRPWARRLEGVDLSRAMLARARDRRCYDALVERDVVEHLAAHPRAYDLVAAAEVLCYFGALEGFLRAARRALEPGGLLVFTVEQSRRAAAVTLAPTGRYAHRTDYVRRALAAARWSEVEVRTAVLRSERGRPVRCAVVAARRPERRRRLPRRNR